LRRRIKMIYTVDILIAGQKVTISGETSPEVKAAAKWLTTHAGARALCDIDRVGEENRGGL
jgi:hypothetical protein